MKILDLMFRGNANAIASYLLETPDGPVIIETGPHSTFEILTHKINQAGYEVKDVRHVLITHIHLDHAGACWAFADHGATIYLHPFGQRHMADPAKLMGSAARIYGDEMDALWGEMRQINPDQLRPVDHGEVLTFGDTSITAWHTPGHAIHHVAWQAGKHLFTGDVAGVRICGGPVMPPCPPPDVDLEAWGRSIKLIRSLDLESLYLTHYGEIKEIEDHLDQLEFILRDWAAWIEKRWRDGQSAEEMTPVFQEYVLNQLREGGVPDADLASYEAANPAWMSVAGLIRYWTKKEQKR